MDVVAYALTMYNDMLYRDCILQIPEKAESLSKMEHSKNVVWLKLQKAEIVGNRRIVRCDLFTSVYL